MANIVLAGPGYTTYQAKIIKPDGYPLEANNVNFRFTILNPLGTCILYSENYSAVNMTGTGGVISFALGSGVKVFPASATTFADVFSNITPALTCDVGGPGIYTPASSDVRKIVMQFHDNSGWQTLPAMNINAVPYAMYANDAQRLGGVSATSFVQRTEIPSCSGGEAMFYNGTNFSCVTLGGGAVSAAAITAALGYTPANGASITAVSSDVSSLASYAANVSSTVFSVSSTVTNLENSFSSFQATTTASFAAISGVGISTFNGSTSATQSLGNSLSGTTPAFVTANGVHTLNIPYASEGTTTAGLISNSEYSLFSTVINKITSSAASIAQVLGYTPADQAAVTTLSSTVGAVSTTANSALALANAVSSSVNSLGSNKITSSAASVAEVLGYTAADQATVAAVSTTANSALTTANSKITSSAAAIEQVLGYVPTDYAEFSSFQSTTVASLTALSGSGISSFNGSSSATQSLGNSLTGTAPAFVTANGVHTLNIPFASAGATTAGLISNTDYSLFSTVINKITSSTASIAQVLGYTPADQVTVAAVSATANSALALANAVSSSVNSLGSNKITSSAASVAEVLGYTAADQAALTALTSTVGAVSTTANSALTTANSKITSSAAAIAQVLGYVPGPATGSTQWTTSGSAITYNSGNVGVGIANPRSKLNVVGSLGLMIGDWAGGTGMNQHQSIAQAPSSFTDSLAEKPFTLIGGNSFLDRSEVLIGGSTNMSSEAAAQNIIFYTHPTKDTALGVERMRVDRNGRVGIATNNPGYALEVSGTIASTNGGYRFPDNTTQTTAFVSGTSGIVQQLGYVPASSATLSSFQAATVASLTALSGAGISAFNGSTSATQSLANGTAGNSPAFVSANGVHTLNIPFASAGATTAGLISNSDYSLFSTVINKITSSAASIAQVLGYTPADQAAVTTLSSTVDAVSTTANAALTAANTKITSSAASIAQVLGYTPAASGGISSQWTTSGTTINYVAGNVGIGTPSPMYPLQVHKAAGGDPNILLTDGDQVHPFSAYYSLIPANTVGYMANNHATGGGLALYGLTSNASTYGLSLNSYLGSASPTVAAFNIVGQKLNGGGATLLASDETLMIVRNLNNPVFTLKGSGNLGIGTTNPVTKLEVSGGVRISMESAACAVSYAGTLRYNAGNVEYCNGTTWTAFGAAGSGVGTFNGSTSNTQTLAAGTTGTAPSFTTANGVHTLNIPYASAGATAAGLISNADYVNFSNKITSSAASIAQVLGYVPAATGAVNPWMALENSTNTSVGPYISFWKNRNYAATQANDELGSMSFYGHDGTGTKRSAAIYSNAEGAPSTNSVPGYITFNTTTSGSTDVSEKMRITASGKVGIGTTNPAATFAVSGTTDIAAANIALPAVGSNGTSQLNNNTLDLSPSSNYTIAGGGVQYVMGDKSTYTITSATTATDLSRLYLMGSQQVVNYAATASTTQVMGASLRTDANAAGAVSSLTGLSLNTRMVNSNAANGVIRGVAVNSIAQGAGGAAGSATDLYGVDSVVSIQGGGGANTFAVTNAFGLRSGVGVASSSGTIGSAYGLYIDNGINATNTGTVTHQYGLFIEEQNLGTTNKWNILSQGVNSKNLFEGRIGLGEFSPSAYLHIGATSGTQASLKINSGTLLASPQPGAIEYDGTNLYYTDGSSTRRTLAAAGAGVGTFNGSTSSTQTLAAGTAGTAPSFTTLNGVHTLNIPYASAGTTTAGLISNTDYVNFSNKITSSAASIAQVLGYVPAASGGVSSQWTTSGTTINYMTGNVGVGTVAPSYKLDVAGTGRFNQQVNINGSSGFPYLTLAKTGWNGSTIGIASGSFTFATNTEVAGDLVIANHGNILFSNNSSQRNDLYIKASNGNVGVGGMVNPTARLHLASGTTTNAAFKIAAGSLLSTPSDGAIEYDGISFYGTNASGTRSSLGSKWTTSGTAIGYTAGSVGIGTVSPRTAFDVAPATGQSIIRATSTNSTSALQLYRNTAGAYAGPVLWSNGTSLNFGYDTTENSGPTLMTLDTNGNLGVGTSGSGAALHVYRATGSDATIALTNASAGNGAYVTSIANSNFTGFTATGVSQTWFTGQYGSRSYVIGDLTNGKIPFTIDSNAPAYNFTMLASGTVGIGVSVPNAKLHIASGSTTVAPFKITSGALTTVAQAGSIEYDGFNFYATNGAGTRASLGSKWTTSGTSIYYNTGNIGVGTTNPISNFQIHQPTGGNSSLLKFTTADSGATNSDGTTLGVLAGGIDAQLWNYENGYFRIGTAGAERLRITSTGNVGIGTGTPAGTLSIENATVPGIQIKTTGAAAVDTFNMINDMDATGIFWFAKGTSATTAPTTANRLVAITNAGNMEIYGQEANGSNDNSGVLALKTQKSTDGGTRNEVSMEFYADGANIDTPSGYLGYESNTVYDLALHNVKSGSLLFGTNNITRMSINSAGNVAVGLASATAKFHLAAGTTSLAPMKLTSGPLLTTPASGSIEYDGFNFYVTNGAGTRSSLSGGGSVTSAAIVTALGYSPVSAAAANPWTVSGTTLEYTGNVAIGSTTDPTTPLQVYGAANATPSVASSIFSTLSSVGTGIFMGSYSSSPFGSWIQAADHTGFVAYPLILSPQGANVAIGNVTNPGSRLVIKGLGTTSATSALNVTDSSNNSKFYVGNDGNVGIGTTAPLAALMVEGSGSSGNRQLVVHDSAALASNVGGGISLGGNSTAGGSFTAFGEIKAGKLNATSGNLSGYLSFSANNGTVVSEAMRITNQGYVGVGTTSPQAILNVNGDTAIGPLGPGFLVTNGNGNRYALGITGNGSSSAQSTGGLYLANNRATPAVNDLAGIISFGSANNGGSNRSVAEVRSMLSGAGGAAGFGGVLAFHTKADNVNGVSETMRIDANGNVGIGTAAPSYPLDVQTQNAFTARLQHSSNNATDGAAIMMTRTRGTLGSNTGVQAGDTIGGYYFRAHNGVDANVTNAAIEVEAYGTQSVSNRANYMIFETTASGTTSKAERMRISESGNVGIGTTNPYALLSIGPNSSGATAYLGYVGSYLSTGGQAQWGGNWASSGYWGIGPSTGTGDNAIRIGNMSTSGTWVATQDAKLVIGSGGLGVGTTPATNMPLDILKTSGDLTARLKADGADTDITLHMQNDVQTWKIMNKAGNNDVFIIEDTTAGNKPSFYIRKTDGRIGIGQTSVAALTYQLEVSGTIAIASGSALRIGNNNICTSGGCTSSSDLRLKENIKPLDFSVEKLLSLKAVQYDWKDKVTYGDKHQIGFIAQELEKVYPEVVYTDKDSGLKSVSYGHLIAPMVEAFKELYAKVNKLFEQTEKNTRAIASLEEKDSAKDKQIEALKIENERKDKELREMKERLDRIEKALLKK